MAQNYDKFGNFSNRQKIKEIETDTPTDYGQPLKEQELNTFDNSIINSYKNPKKGLAEAMIEGETALHGDLTNQLNAIKKTQREEDRDEIFANYKKVPDKVETYYNAQQAKKIYNTMKRMDDKIVKRKEIRNKGINKTNIELSNNYRGKTTQGGKYSKRKRKRNISKKTKRFSKSRKHYKKNRRYSSKK